MNHPTDDLPKRRGRPNVPAPLAPVSFRLPPDLQRRLVQIANQRDQSISATARQLVILRLRA